MQIFQSPNYDFLRWRWHAIVLSIVVILAGLGSAVSQGGLPLGIDFSGGTIVVVGFDEPVTADQVRSAVSGAVSGDIVVQRYDEPEANEWLVRLPQIEGIEEGASLEEGANQVVSALTAAGLPSFEMVSTEIVGPVIGAELQRRGIYATLTALGAIGVYMAFRFSAAFAVGALVATFHDVLITLAFLTLFGYELSLNVIAAVLAITGYSVNDTIVIFDRVRENLRSMRRDSLAHVVNTAVNQTLARTVITSGTTFVAVLMLFLFGGEVLRGFSFTMLVGVVSGTYSTVFIAAAVALIMSQRRAASKSGAAASTAEASRPAGAPPRRGKARKARAS